MLYWIIYALAQQEKFNWHQLLLRRGKRFGILATLPENKEDSYFCQDVNFTTDLWDHRYYVTIA